MKRKKLKENLPDKGVKSRKSDTSESVHPKIAPEVRDEKTFVANVKQLLKNQATLLTGLTRLRGALRDNDGKGFRVFAEFVKENSECPQIYKALERIRQSEAPLELQIALEVLEELLLMTAKNSNYLAVGMYHVRKLLQNHLKLLYSCLNPSCHHNMIKVVLKLLVAMVAQGAFAAREIVGVFDFSLKAFGSLVSKHDSKNGPTIRACYMQFVMSFLMFGDDSTIRHILDIKGFVSSIFKLLPSDPLDIITMVIKTLQEKVVKNSFVPKKTKVLLFNSYVLTQLSRLYSYNIIEEDGENIERENIIEMVHELLQDVCCTFKYGICFGNKLGMFAGRSNNPVLLRFLQSIPKNNTHRVLRQLVIKILMCCPDLVHPYLTSLKLTYEPRLSLPWLANIGFIIKIYTLLPMPSVMIRKANIDLNTASLLQSVLNTVLPLVITRLNLNQGLQHPSLLVKNTTLTLINLVLSRAADLTDICKKDNSSSSAIDSFSQLFTDGLLKVLPDIKTVVSLRQNLLANKEQAKDVLKVEEGVQVDDVSLECEPSQLLSNTIRVLYGYQKIQPLILSCLEFDLGKLLPGPDQFNESLLPGSVLHYTLKILLDLPQGTLKWYQKKSKQGPSSMYSVLKILVSSDNPDIKSVAKSVISKFLLDEGIIEDNSHEMEIWLRHLSNKSFAPEQDSLVLFLDSVFYSVAMEPYTYTDIVMEMTSQASLTNQRMPLQNCVDTSSRVGFSPLVVRALMYHVKLASSFTDGYSGYTTKQLGIVAQYINLIILDFIYAMANPLPLMMSVQRFYGDVMLPRELSLLHRTHHSLLKYVSTWTGYLIESRELEEDRKLAKKLMKSFLKKKEMCHDELTSLLCHLNEDQLRDSIIAQLEICVSNHDVSTLAEHVTCTPYCVIGSLQVSEEILLLAKELPFPTLLWQLLGPLLINSSVTQPGTTLRDYTALKSLKMQEILVDSLRNVGLDYYSTMCNHLLHYLGVFRNAYDCVTGNARDNEDDVTVGTVTLSRSDLESALFVLYKLLEMMIENLCYVHKEDLSQDLTDDVVAVKPSVTIDRDILREFCDAFFSHPVLHWCLVRKPENGNQDCTLPGLVSSLSHMVETVLNNIVVEVALVQPYINAICKKAVIEISKASHNKDFVSDLQSLQLLQAFSSYCDHQNRSQVIASLAELPLDKLIHHNKAKDSKEPTFFYQTLLSLLTAYHMPHVARTANQNELNSDLRHVTSKANRSSDELTSGVFERLIHLATIIASPGLDKVIHQLIKTSPKLLTHTKSAFLDYCLDNSTHERISMATCMVSSSVSLRIHFERRCCTKTKDKSISPLNTERLEDLLPVVKSYLDYSLNIGVDQQDKKVFGFIYKKYWPYLWKWILDKKQGDERENIKFEVLKLLTRCKDNDIHNINDKVTSLLNIVPDQVLDPHQMSIVQTILGCLPDCDEKCMLIWHSLSVYMHCVSIALTSDLDCSSKVEKYLENIYDCITRHKDQFQIKVKGSGIESNIWTSFVKACLKHNFDSLTTLTCMSACIKLLYNSSRRKSLAREFPLTSAYELVLTHSKFLEVMMLDQRDCYDRKEAVLSLVVTIAEMNPDCCEQTHLPVFLAAYTASLSKSDQLILYLLHLYERAQVSLSSYRPYLWGKAALEQHKIRKMQGPSLWQQPSTSEVLELLDEAVLNRSSREFPLQRKLRPGIQNGVDCSLYDPSFMVPLFCHLLSPNSEVDCRKFVERGGLGYSAAALSSRDDHMRKAAGHVLSRFLTHLEAASFREKKQVVLLLVSFKNGIIDINSRISSVITRFISRVGHVMLRPEHQMYFILNSFLLQRAAMDHREVPMFYTLFNSSSLQYRNERVWILELLLEGLRDAQDYYVYKKRHVMELVMSFYDSQLSDHLSRKLVISLVRASLTIHSAAFDLAKNYGIVGWIHSLCLKRENESLGTSLSLLHTLWFTIQQGKPSACEDISSVEEDHIPVPPNLALETLLVCKTCIQCLSFTSTLEDVSLLIELLSSVLSYLGKDSQQDSQLTHEELLSLLTQWSKVFNEGEVWMMLKDEVGFSLNHDGCFPCSKSQEDTAACKEKALHQLIQVVTHSQTMPCNTQDSSLLIPLLVFNSTLEFSYLKGDVTSCLRHHKLVMWFRQCLVTSLSLLKIVLSPKGERLINRLLCLYTHIDTKLIHELNSIFWVLMSRVQHVDTDELGYSANEVARLLSEGVYSEIMSSGLTEVLLPLYPSPCERESNFNGNNEVSLTELVSVFIQDLWFAQPVPSRFLETLVKSRCDAAKKLHFIVAAQFIR